MRKLEAGFGVVLALVMAGCAAMRPGGDGDEAPALLPSLQASTFGEDSVVFLLQVTNTTGEPIPLEFTSGQSFDFVVTQGSRGVWTWSADRSFIQEVRRERLAPGTTETYRAAWVPAAGTSGEFTVVGMLTAQNQRVRQTIGFRLP